MSQEMLNIFPPRFSDLKKEIASLYPDFQDRATQSWKEVLEELEKTTKIIASEGPNYLPQVKFSDLGVLSEEKIGEIKRKGCLVIKGVVDTNTTEIWKSDLETFVKVNPDVPGYPDNDKQLFSIYWTSSQVAARSHPNVLTASIWLNGLYHTKKGQELDGTDLKTPLSYADRFRIRHPSPESWSVLPPHVDGGGIERWEDPEFRKCFSDILSGNWRQHDPYSLDGRLNARTSMYGRPNQATVFRAFQGWLALSETGPGKGTLQVFPDVILSNAYTILRPFFRPIDESQDSFDSSNWVFDTSSPDFPGIISGGGGFYGPRPTPESHPHMNLASTMTCMPPVQPGDMVFWHCDVVHAVEKEHTGSGNAIVIYIPAVPSTPQNAAYVQRQKDSFANGRAPPDFPEGVEAGFVGLGKPEHILGPLGRQAMGFPAEAI